MVIARHYVAIFVFEHLEGFHYHLCDSERSEGSRHSFFSSPASQFSRVNFFMRPPQSAIQAAVVRSNPPLQFLLYELPRDDSFLYAILEIDS